MPDPRRDTKSLISLAAYLERPRTLQEICDRYDLSERTAYRWLDYLREDGIEVASIKSKGELKFRVLFS
jgi:predicted DNA-binding transcriptional regulator YafY